MRTADAAHTHIYNVQRALPSGSDMNYKGTQIKRRRDMPKNLVIVESPAKAKTIEKFLGSDYKVTSSYGHIRDLKKRGFSIDLEHDYTPIYEVPAEKAVLVDSLKKAAAGADIVWLASDEDREGEAISWHLYEVLKLKPETTRRIVFHEITKPAILHAIESPRDIDLNLVDAQQARRVLDRIVGFELSPVLWRKVKPSLSAGRVQSVAVRLIVEREREINDFKVEESYRVVGTFKGTDREGRAVTFNAELNKRFDNKAEAQAFLQHCSNATFEVSDVSKRPTKRSPAPPFTTSTLQQEAARKLSYSVTRTMSIAQRLYESGLITYMRTDSLNLSTLALSAAQTQIVETMGEEYHKYRTYHTHSKGAQEAHEAIRPTYMNQTAIEGSVEERRLYDLIWKRTIASQMADAQLERTTVDIAVSGTDARFVASGEIVIFNGFLRVYTESNDDDSNSDTREHPLLPAVTPGEALTLDAAEATLRYSSRPSRYTEASLVKKMEELGIGRPSTYAPTISTIQARDYVEKCDRPAETRPVVHLKLKKGKITETEDTESYGNDRGKLMPTDVGILVTDYLSEHFPDILNYNFTAEVEEKFDEIAEGKANWHQCIGDFYNFFHPLVTASIDERTDRKAGERVLGTDPKTGLTVLVKVGQYGPMVQLGAQGEVEKPKFASLRKGQSIYTLTLEEALDVFSLPKDLGEYEGKTVTVAVGRFGPYVKHDGKFASIDKGIDPLDVTLDKAIELINAKREAESKRCLRTFDEDEEMQILNGRFGPYIAKAGKNYRIPRTKKADELTYEDCLAIIKESESGEKPAPRRPRAAAKSKKE
jgi:DNA topoisomerase-1